MHWPTAWSAAGSDQERAAFIQGLKPESFASAGEATMAHWYQLLAGLANWLDERTKTEAPRLLAISGAQGTGKTTLARHLQQLLALRGYSVARLSLDDFYLPGATRAALSNDIHPLLQTRGVPGTHDLAWLVSALKALKDNRSVMVPQFDKLRDERMQGSVTLGAPNHLIILEGWCLGAMPVEDSRLLAPVNQLEAEEDPHGVWRQYVNACMGGKSWQVLHRLFDALLYIQVPNFNQVLDWRWQQEQELAALPGAGEAMTKAALHRFVSHFERITLQMQATMMTLADLIFVLDGEHQVEKIVLQPATPNKPGSQKP
ncbi:MAG: kinase [Gammaproteobacteria bacterium]|nr:kinase [Gammaproteobacteria bacterium]